MAGNLTRFTPQSAFDMLDFMQPGGLLEGERIPLDVSETDQAYLVKAEMPGVKREDIKVVIQGDQISISAVADAQEERAEGNIVYRERYRGRKFRSFTLPQAVDEENAHGSYHEGVLALNLPKNGGTGARQLTIQ